MSSPQYSHRVYVARFGRYEGARPNEYPANEVLVGRERERARMMDWLLTFGNRGAYLVTGYRGVGKTSFVKFCIRQYEDDVYGRYLQSKAGRTLFWDRIAASALVSLTMFIPVLASQLLRRLWETEWNQWLLLRWLPLAPLFLVSLHPLAYSLPLISRATCRPGSGWHRKLVLYAIALSVPLLLVGLSSSGPEAVAFSLVLLGWTYLVSHGSSVTKQGDPRRMLDRDPGAAKFHGGLESRPRLMGWWTGGVVLFTFTTLLLESVAAPVCAPLLLTAAWCTICGLWLRIQDARRLSAYLGHHPGELGRSAADSDRTANAHGVLLRCFVGGMLLALTIHWFDVGSNAAFAWLPKSLTVADVEPWEALWEARVVFIGLPMIYALNALEWRRTLIEESSAGDAAWFYFHPRPRLVLVLKAAFTFVLTVQVLRDLFQQPLVGFLSGSSSVLIFWMSKNPAFQDWRAEALWLALAGVFVFFLLYMEHDWIARRHERVRQDDAYDMLPMESADEKLRSKKKEGEEPTDDDSRLQHLYLNRELANSTTFWSLFRTWLPVITVRVNLGFDNLSHAQVVTAMLAGLRNEYFRLFISWRSRLGLIWRAVGVLTLFVLSIELGNVAHASNFPYSALLSQIYIPIAVDRQSHLIDLLLPVRAGEQNFGIMGYHVVAFVVLVVLARTLGARIGFSYYRAIYAKLNRMLDSLSSNVRHVHARGRMSFNPPFVTAEEPTETSQTDTPPQDPRTIEQTFLDILRDIQEPRIPLPVSGHLVSLPAPQITFVFDELDKIGVRSIDRAADGLMNDNYTGDRERSRQIHRLLADMKNLLSSAPARFVFVGGRELHDEWLADLTARQPLLSNVFDGEIYLPTLLADRIEEGPQEHGMLHGIYAYLNAQLSRTHKLYDRWEHRRRWGDQWFNVFRNEPEQFFVQRPKITGPLGLPAPRRAGSAPTTNPSPSTNAAPTKIKSPPELTDWRLYDITEGFCEGETGHKDGAIHGHVVDWEHEFFEQLAEYLAFRSRGNPKRLNGLIERFVRPVGRVVFDPTTRWTKFDCQHVLRFGHVERFNIQLLANIYRRLNLVIRARVDFGDDKIIRSALYLADFLLKFHRRAFSWTSLERIDEVLHVHRAPDLRRLLSELLLQWSQCFVHPILEGMHAFRFRSEIAAEVRYISRSSDGEMAAFNFTLDEAQALKSEYQARLDRLSAKDEARFELRAALGELHDFDEDYEEARRHYNAAIEEIDSRVARILGTDPEKGIFVQMLEPTRSLTRQMGWSVARLRLMLQIGMTYERSRNYERAFAEYRDARTLSHSIILALLDDVGRYSSSIVWENEAWTDGAQLDATLSDTNGTVRRPNELESLKHLPILYQPLFACAWLSEKAPSAIDTSLSLVEEALRDARKALPFVRRPGPIPKPARGPTHLAHAHFSLAVASLHHNAGNLFFFKGRQTGDTFVYDAAPDGARGDGYLPRAAYHYAQALVDVQRFTQYRLESSANKLISWDPEYVAPDGSQPPLPADLWPEFLLRRTAAALFGLADVWLARVSLRRLVGEQLVGGTNEPAERELREQKDFVAWMSGTSSGFPNRAFDLLQKYLRHPPPLDNSLASSDCGSLRPPSMPPMSGFFRPEQGTRYGGEWAKVSRYLTLSGWGARLLDLGGHHEEAARERIWSAQCVETLGWSLQAQASVMQREYPERWDTSPTGPGFPNQELCALLLKEGAHAIRRASELIQKAAATSRESTEPSMPTHAKRIARSLGLLAIHWHLDADGADGAAAAPAASLPIWEEFWRLAMGNRDRNGPAKSTFAGAAIDFRRQLHESLERNAYSMLNQLMTLHVLVIDTALSQSETGKTSPSTDAFDLVDELARLTEEYSSPLHFTPFHYGTAVMLWALSQTGTDERRDAVDVKRGTAKSALARSREMYSSAGAYYETIADLSYLDDDFNDRCFHVHHALQMMGADLTSALLRACRRHENPSEGAPLRETRDGSRVDEPDRVVATP